MERPIGEGLPFRPEIATAGSGFKGAPAATEDGIAFLEAHGWKIEAVREGHYKFDEGYVDEVMMAVSCSAAG